MFVAVVVGGSWGTNLAVGAVRLPALVSRQRHRPPGRNHVAIRLSNVLMSGQLNQHCPNPSNSPMVILWEGSNQFDDLHILKCIFYLIQKGEVVCGAIQCPVAPCRNPVLGPADCCPTCLSNVPFNLNLLIPHHLHQSSSSPRNPSSFFLLILPPGGRPCWPLDGEPICFSRVLVMAMMADEVHHSLIIELWLTFERLGGNPEISNGKWIPTESANPTCTNIDYYIDDYWGFFYL